MYSTLKPYSSIAVSAIIDPPVKCTECGLNLSCKRSVCMCKSNYSLGNVQLIEPQQEFQNPPIIEPLETPASTTLTWTLKPKVATNSPEVNGPPFWFVLHNGAAHLPDTLSPISAKRIQLFIDGIPEMQPCTNCAEHARAYIEKNKEKISKLNTRDSVFKFFVDFHNYVNQRLGKRIFSYEEAYAMYRSGIDVKVLKY